MASAFPSSPDPGVAVLEAAGLTRHYRTGRDTLRAVDGVSSRLEAGSTLAVVGESGCGKSTLARMSALQEPPTAGTISIAGQDAAGPARRTLQLQNQMVFQNPYGGLVRLAASVGPWQLGWYDDVT